MITSYHNHTRWSDGSSTVREAVAAAASAGLDEVGISDHLTLLPSGTIPSWSVAPDALSEYVGDVLSAMDASTGPIVRVGIEADYVPGMEERLREVLERQPFDYVIGSVHYAKGILLDGHQSRWEGLSEADRNEVWREYWRRVRGLAESRAFDFVGHLDLPKKFRHRPTDDQDDLVRAALDAIAASDMAVEINTSGWHVPAEEAYPGPDLLAAVRARAIPVLVNADAHHAEHVTRDLERGRELARSAGYTEVVRYEGRRRFPVPL